MPLAHHTYYLIISSFFLITPWGLNHIPLIFLHPKNGKPFSLETHIINKCMIAIFAQWRRNNIYSPFNKQWNLLWMIKYYVPPLTKSSWFHKRLEWSAKIQNYSLNFFTYNNSLLSMYINIKYEQMCVIRCSLYDVNDILNWNNIGVFFGGGGE